MAFESIFGLRDSVSEVPCDPGPVAQPRGNGYAFDAVASEVHSAVATPALEDRADAAGGRHLVAMSSKWRHMKVEGLVSSRLEHHGARAPERGAPSLSRSTRG